ncbi:MAG: undecaprenyl-phosphate galactose phosphotransferase WbaP [Chloroflexi bacterium]|nr:undecaprenyl-phosphate galactose phosphotransferase WbaP [Chloroflexota bacterium]
MNEETISSEIEVFSPSIRSVDWTRNRRTLMSLMLVLTDLIAINLAWVIAVFLRFTFWGWETPGLYESYMLVLPFSFLINLSSGLYNHNLSQVEELQRVSKSVSTFYLIGASILFLSKEGTISRLVVLLAWMGTIVLTPFLRELMRTIMVRLKLWGEPVILFGNGQLGKEIADYLKCHPKMGYNPVCIVDRRKEKRQVGVDKNVIHDVTIFTQDDELPEWLQNVQTAFVITPETSETVQEMLIGKQTVRFKQLILVRSGEKTGSLWVQPLDIGGILGLDVGQNLLSQSQLLVKRWTDLTLIALSSIFIIPFFGLIGLLIKLDSPGSVFYKQERIGYGGKPFKLWKFRSMCMGADQKLFEFLENNPDLKAEYEVTHKLKNDPRLTRVGKFMRKFSIDELPQLINVVKGEMSLVGPRPFLPYEIDFYKNCYTLYTYVYPGITGLWQISGRSNVSYNTRTDLDEYYLRNWSIWMDIHILLRTFWVVLRRDGAC